MDSYVFQRFFTMFVMTFVICIFILLMQFLWKHFNDLIGKGIGFGVISEFFLYSAATLVPMALPLAILLASIMTFGNLGENFELTAMKSAGISLFRIMRPILIFIVALSGLAFVFSNNILPVSQAKLWSLIFSIREKSPELDIPVGEFYSGIPSINLYVRDKDQGLLKDMMIYDFSQGFENASVMVADSGRVKLSADKKFLLLQLFDGETFENLKGQNFSTNSNNIPYRRESFSEKEILIDFDTDFNRYDESLLQDAHISKDIAQLDQTIDSLTLLINTQFAQQANEYTKQRYFGRENYPERSLEIEKSVDLELFKTDSLFLKLDRLSMQTAVETALQRANEKKGNIEYNKIVLGNATLDLVRHAIEWQRKFTLSFACLIFFFIGAPLGAIIRKGGLGAPVVISVILFIIYYIIDNTGLKMAREGIMTPFEGMWLSSSILLPVGIFLTYKAAVDATLFNAEEYSKRFERIKLFITTKTKRKR